MTILTSSTTTTLISSNNNNTNTSYGHSAPTASQSQYLHLKKIKLIHEVKLNPYNSIWLWYTFNFNCEHT